MKTYRDIVYILLDELKILSDDSVWETDHLVQIVNKYRALLVKQRYLDKKKEIPTAFYQRLNVYFDTSYYSGNIYKSLNKIPNSIDGQLLNTYSFVSPSGMSSLNYNLISPQRFKVVGRNKWIRNEVYVAIDLDKHMYLRSSLIDLNNNVNVAVSDVDFSTYLTKDDSDEYEFIFDGISGSYIVYDTILDNPIEADIFNEDNTLDVLDLEFPCDISLIQTIVELTINEIAKLNGIPRDVSNNANDDNPIVNQK